MSIILKLKIRIARIDEIDPIEALMKRSMQFLGKGHYTEAQIDSCCKYVCVPDKQLIEDGSFFVVETEQGHLAGCGGWSFRNKLYAGPSALSHQTSQLDPATDPARIRAMFIDPNYSGQGIGSLILKHSESAAKERGFYKGALGATMSGFAFYQAKGWEPVSEENAPLPDGTTIKVIQMAKNL